ncbi:hypothetical protein HHK36_007729 [Tetracentron sinense]|uniref:Uncharacterized protein n=1 Tax=Tetracentron sinense TaxID=13715 RepID=A0A834ZI86_TETSI|nr:hypothetical protein HHK36_007729 [Tetracentron sinense]
MDSRVEDGTFLLMDISKEKQCVSMKMKRIAKPKKKEFIGWGSKPLIEFLASIGKDTSKQFSQYDVTEIINEYVRENKLLHPVKKKKVLCDAKLQYVFGRKSVNRNKINDLLEAHFAENLEQSEEDEFIYGSEEKEENGLMACKRQRKSSTLDKRSDQKEKVLEAPRSCFASVTAINMKLVYLKKSLVEDFLKHPETFEDRVMGSFVRVKSDPNDCFQRNSHQLLQVTGIKKASRADDLATEILLQGSHFKKDIPICMLSDDDFSEEECDDLRQRVKDGLLKRPTVVELEQKVRSLHEDITKHLLQTPSEQLRLLQEVPKVIADQIELETNPQDCLEDEKLVKDCLLRSVLTGVSSDDLSGNKTASCLMFGRTDATGNGDAINENAASKMIISASAEDGEGNGDVVNENTAEKEAKEEKQNHVGVSIPEERLLHSEASVSEELQCQSSAYFADEQQKPPVEVEERSRRETRLVSLDENLGVQGTVDRQRVLADQLIELSDDDEDPNVTGNQTLEDPESFVWHYMDPQGDIQGPFSMLMLNCWSESSYFAPDFKVWKTGQTQEEAILLTDLLCRMFPKK